MIECHRAIVNEGPSPSHWSFALQYPFPFLPQVWAHSLPDDFFAHPMFCDTLNEIWTYDLATAYIAIVRIDAQVCTFHKSRAIRRFRLEQLQEVIFVVERSLS
mmetsp:Transcript_26902/g.75476  ORF Transcript_26902/g.75476 Transcript_26902/m.75476 type:complete len:103 (+) Transcript_26902:98-406(+)